MREAEERVDRQVGTKEVHNSPLLSRGLIISPQERGKEGVERDKERRERERASRLVQPRRITRWRDTRRDTRRDIRFCTIQRPREIRSNRIFNRAESKNARALLCIIECYIALKLLCIVRYSTCYSVFLVCQIAT